MVIIITQHPLLNPSLPLPKLRCLPIRRCHWRCHRGIRGSRLSHPPDLPLPEIPRQQQPQKRQNRPKRHPAHRPASNRPRVRPRPGRHLGRHHRRRRHRRRPLPHRRRRPVPPRQPDKPLAHRCLPGRREKDRVEARAGVAGAIKPDESILPATCRAPGVIQGGAGVCQSAIHRAGVRATYQVAW